MVLVSERVGNQPDTTAGEDASNQRFAEAKALGKAWHRLTEGGYSGKQRILRKASAL